MLTKINNYRHHQTVQGCRRKVMMVHGTPPLPTTLKNQTRLFSCAVSKIKHTPSMI